MSTLYIANVTHQGHDFAFRIPGEDLASFKRLSYKFIEPGKQVQILGDEPLAVLEAIVEQHRQYGIVSADEAVKCRGFIRLVYSFDKPVNIDVIRYAIDHDRGVLFDDGLRERRSVAVAIDDTFENQLRQPMRAVEVELLEDRPATEPSDAQLSEGLRVVHDQTVAHEGGVRQGRGSR